ncbi:hypothetical protein [Nannocystis pusilla]|uniref:Cytochrome c domain-containing protein n=1 Tax=Nannocystis pusilla TaxID=889268 RepID=A0ABS7U3Z2_9BACT|nr:hypothetical protein [Nannocystis pusilla]MBZ5715274.1 hypothetical protein [Nannocystis pusilla]
MADNTLVYGGLAALLFLAFGGKASAKPSEPKPSDPEDEIIPLPDDDSGDDDEVIPVPDDVPSANWGATPAKWLIPFATAESATQGTLPGLARYMAIRSWTAYRAGQGLVSFAEAQAIAAAAPNLCRQCHNTSASERNASCRGIERVTLPKGTKGPCGGVGAYEASKVWPVSPYNAAWKDFGSAGLMDILASTALYTGKHEGFTPLLNEKPEILYDPRAQMYIIGVMVYRIVKGSYPVLSPTPRETWTKIHRVVSTGSLSNSAANIAVGTRFQNRAAELGIDLDKFDELSGGGMPTLQTIGNWPGAQAYSDALAGIQVG